MNNLLRLLADGHFHSGEELGASMGISRSAVWKALGRLEQEFGVRLFRVPGKGYRLVGPLSLLHADRLGVVTSRLGWSLYLKDSVDSTNAEAFRLLQSGCGPSLVVLAEAQTAGRGRRGRLWVSPPAQNIYCTLAHRVHGGFERMSGLSLVVGLAVLAALRRAGLESAGLKWPNDVYASGKKLAGILVELAGDPADICHVVIGIGINVNMVPDGQAIDQPWTSMKAQLGSTVDRNMLAEVLIEALHDYLGRYADGGFRALREEWEANNIWQGRRCALSTGGVGREPVSGLVMGVDDRGALRLMVDGKGEQSFSGGELSLRLGNDS